MPYHRACFTPIFPSYPSGHATFGTACFNILKRVRAERQSSRQDPGRIDHAGPFVSDELNGISIDNLEMRRGLICRSLHPHRTDDRGQQTKAACISVCTGTSIANSDHVLEHVWLMRFIELRIKNTNKRLGLLCWRSDVCFSNRPVWLKRFQAIHRFPISPGLSVGSRPNESGFSSPITEILFGGPPPRLMAARDRAKGDVDRLAR